MIRTPFNWVGNKHDYVEFVNTLLIGKQYNRVIDPFLGSGNLLLNVRVKADEFIGNDIIRLIPNIFNYISELDDKFTLKDVKNVESKWGFDLGEQYYTFKDFWNDRYRDNEMDKEFVIETVMLLKMCLNSMIRFNQKGEFNQGFRGLSKSKRRGSGKFFNSKSLMDITSELNSLSRVLHSSNFTFYNKDYKEIICDLKEGDLLLLDPPYILTNTPVVYGGSYGTADEEYLLNLLREIDNDFILFNYMSNSNMEHDTLKQLVDDMGYKSLVVKTKGKLKSICNENTSQEVLITNIK